MYGSRSMRMMVGLAAVAATLALTAPSYATSVSKTFATSDPGWGNVIVVSYSAADYDRAFDFAPLAIYDAQPAVTQRSGQTYIPMTVKTQRFGAAVVNATSKAGWGSGRLRKLAG